MAEDKHVGIFVPYEMIVDEMNVIGKILWDRLQALTGDAYNMRKTAQFAALGGLWMKTMDEALGQDVTARRIAFEAAKDIAVAIRQSGDAGPLVEVV